MGHWVRLPMRQERSSTAQKHRQVWSKMGQISAIWQWNGLSLARLLCSRYRLFMLKTFPKVKKRKEVRKSLSPQCSHETCCCQTIGNASCLSHLGTLLTAAPLASSALQSSWQQISPNHVFFTYLFLMGTSNALMGTSNTTRTLMGTINTMAGTSNTLTDTSNGYQ